MEAKGICGSPVTGSSGSVGFSDSLLLNKLVEVSVADSKWFEKWAKQLQWDQKDHEYCPHVGKDEMWFRKTKASLLTWYQQQE